MTVPELVSVFPLDGAGTAVPELVSGTTYTDTHTTHTHTSDIPYICTHTHTPHIHHTEIYHTHVQKHT